MTPRSAMEGIGMEEEKDEKVRLNIYVARSIMEELQKIKKETGRSLLDLVREALWRYVKFYNEELGDGKKE